MVCSSQHCTSKAFICNTSNCKCRSQHKLCLQLSIQSLQKIALANSYTLAPLKQQIDNLFNQTIEQLCKEKLKIIKEIQSLYQIQNIGLNEYEKKFVNAVKRGHHGNDITCQFVWKLHLEPKTQNNFKSSQNYFQTQISKIKHKFTSELANLSTKITLDLKASLNHFQNQIKQISESSLFQNSYIVKTTSDSNKLLAFFTQKKIQSVKMLYRASQNEFLVSKWHQTCDKTPNTLTIVQTEYNKVFGGFTVFPWSKSGQWVSAVNRQKDNFLFSLTHNDKLLPTQNCQFCIYCDDNDARNGPIFGKGNDICIHNKANENNFSCANPGRTFTNQNYKCDDSQSHARFGGAYQFKIREWEVWEVIFCQ